MKQLTLKKIADAVNGQLKTKFNSIKIDGVATDSRRDDLSGSLFTCLTGERFDGHDFVRDAIAKGAACILSEKRLDTLHPVILVPSAREALKNLAAYYRSLFDIHVVAVTGSVGKTTTKDMIAQVLSAKYKTLKTEGNFNNDIGLPLCMFRLDDSYQAAVFELGMNRPGEIRSLSKIVRPTVSVITNIGVAHIENFSTKEGILRAKTEIFEFLAEDGHIILNGDDELLKTIRTDKRQIHYFGRHHNNYYSAFNIRNNGLIGVVCTFRYGGNEFKANIPLPGGHIVDNALAAVAAGDILGLGAEGIKNGLESVRPLKMRMDVLNAPGGVTLINDVYNASPNSVMAGLDVLSGVGSRKVCILGDMLELGEASLKYHNDIGAYAAQKRIDSIVCVGALSRETYNGAKKHAAKTTECAYYADSDALLPNLDKLTEEGDTVLVKASRAMRFERVVDAMMRRGGNDG